MNTPIRLSVMLAVLLWTNPLCAGQLGFETTSQGMTERLLGIEAPKDRTDESKGDDHWESLSPQRARSEPTKTIRVLKKEGDRDVWETIEVGQPNGRGSVNMKIQFDVNAYTIRPESLSLLDELAKSMADPRLQKQTFQVIGHTDSDGSEAYNLQLSLKRAQAVKAYLIHRHALSSDRIEVFGYGEMLPLKPNTSAANKQINRRVEIMLAD